MLKKFQELFSVTGIRTKVLPGIKIAFFLVYAVFVQFRQELLAGIGIGDVVRTHGGPVGCDRNGCTLDELPAAGVDREAVHSHPRRRDRDDRPLAGPEEDGAVLGDEAHGPAHDEVAPVDARGDAHLRTGGRRLDRRGDLAHRPLARTDRGHLAGDR